MTGLLAPAPIKWLLDVEKDARDYVKAFILDEAPQPFLDVAGAPDPLELFTAKIKDLPAPLPVVRLHMRMVKNHISGLPHVEVSASDRDIDEIELWRRQVGRAKAEALLQHMRERTIIAPPN